MIEISVLLTIRNWEIQRVRMCLASLADQVDVIFETVMVDYGSDDPEPLVSLAAEFDVRLVRVEADEWSRSRAMNIAAANATGRFFIFADADLVFDPKVLSATRDQLVENPRSVLMFSYRDLPPSVSPLDLQSRIDYEALDGLAIWRPRWGMGTQAYPADAFWAIRGFDERMKIYGGEDNDIAKRARAHGYRLIWVNERQFGLYHVWHPSSRELAISNPEHKKELEKNSAIAKRDNSILRNLNWRSEDRPLVSVFILVFPDSQINCDSIAAVLEQSIQDFEILILDYSNSEHVGSALESIHDSRVRYLKSVDDAPTNLFLAPTKEARGKYITVIKCGDILVPWSLESRLKAITPGAAGSFGGIFSYSSESGELSPFPGKDLGLSTLLENVDVLATQSLLVESEMLKIVRDEASVQPLSDFDLLIRFARLGVQLRHCGDFVALRPGDELIVSVESDTHLSTFSQKLAWGKEQRSKSRKLGTSIDVYKYPTYLEDQGRIATYLPKGLVRKGYLFTPSTHGGSTARNFLECEVVDVEGKRSKKIFTDSLENLPPEVLENLTTVPLPNDEDLSLSELFVSNLNRIYGDSNFLIHNWFEDVRSVRIFLDTQFDSELCEVGYCSIFMSEQEAGILAVLEQGTIQ